ncbi:MAG: hypothetical protein ACXWC4_21890 [Telluria sp.]
MRVLAFAAAAGLAPALCVAQPGPPPLPDLDRLSSSALALPATVSFGGFKLQLEETSLARFRDAARTGEIGRRGDAGESLDWLCYALDSSVNIWLSASELSGGKRIDLVQLVDSGGQRCPVLPRNLRPVTLTDGLAMGVPQERLLQKIGRPSAIRAGWWLYQRTSKVGAYDRINTFGAHLSNGRIDGLFTLRSTTN